MKARLTYKLPEEEKDFLKAAHSANLAMALWDISTYLRKVDKYATGDDIEKIRHEFFSILEQYDINLDSLIE